MDIYDAIDRVKQLGGELYSSQELYRLLDGTELPYFVSSCACGAMPSDVRYVAITNDKLERRAERRPFCGVAVLNNGGFKYSAISDCYMCGKSQPIMSRNQAFKPDLALKPKPEVSPVLSKAIQLYNAQNLPGRAVEIAAGKLDGELKNKLSFCIEVPGGLYVSIVKRSGKALMIDKLRATSWVGLTFAEVSAAYKRSKAL